jgi:hypothetical protein
MGPYLFDGANIGGPDTKEPLRPPLEISPHLPAGVRPLRLRLPTALYPHIRTPAHPQPAWLHAVKEAGQTLIPREA